MKIKKNKKGFTLVEVIIVLAILIMVTAIIIPNFKKIKEKHAKKADIDNCKVIRTITNLIITENKIVYSTTNLGKIIIDCRDKTVDGYPTITVSGLIEPSLEDAQSILQEHFIEVKEPQQINGGGYTIIIDTDGRVEGVMANKHEFGVGKVGAMLSDTFIGEINP